LIKYKNNMGFIDAFVSSGFSMSDEAYLIYRGNSGSYMMTGIIGSQSDRGRVIPDE
jgi:hypothetical protein